jgi:anti-sigma B factor antagonist
MMELTTEELPDGVQKIVLAGRMDSAGTHAIETRFAALTSTRPAHIIVDCSRVSFLASVGIRRLVSSAKTLSRCGGRLVLAGPQPVVEETLRLCGIDTLIPVYSNVDAACADFRMSNSG